MPPLTGRQTALVELGATLRESGYRFVTPTPETHRRVVERPGHLEARTLRDVFGWTRPFRPSLLSAHLLDLCRQADVLAPVQGTEEMTSRVRFSTLETQSGSNLFVHSAYPTSRADAVFFGPDSYRYAAVLARTIWKARRLVDVGCGTGVGGLVLAARVDEMVLADVSPHALELAAVNAALAGHAVDGPIKLCESDVLANVAGDFDAVIANPPYLVDAAASGGGRLYRDGGGPLGIDLAARIATSSLERLRAGRGGQLVLYTGVPIIDGRNVLQDVLEPSLRAGATHWAWEELDPDVFGEELERAAYRDAERIAVVVLTAQVD